MIFLLFLLLLVVRADDYKDGIPKLLHVSMAGWNTRSFTMMHYVNIKAAYIKLNRPSIQLWVPSTHPLNAENDWQRLSGPYMTLRHVANVNYPSCPPAYIDRLMALKSLYAQGGIYMDISMLILRSFTHHFRYNRVLIGREFDASDSSSGSLIVARKHDPFVQALVELYEDACSRSTKDNVNVNGVSSLVKMFNHVHVMHQSAFYSPSWDRVDAVVQPMDYQLWGRYNYVYRVWDALLPFFQDIQPQRLDLVFSQNLPLWSVVRPHLQHLHPSSLHVLWQVDEKRTCPVEECMPPHRLEQDGACYADEWIVPGLLSPSNCTLSDTSEWSRVHWLVWTGDAFMLSERHFRMVEMIYAHDPHAVVFLVTTQLVVGTFAYLVHAGYRFHHIDATIQKLLHWGWYTGHDSRQFLVDAHMHETSHYFSNHLSMYLRLAVLYRYGGIYADMDTLWLRRPITQEGFLAKDQDGQWSTNILAARRGWKFLQRFVERTFGHYNPNCPTCHGSAAFSTLLNPANMAIDGFQLVPSGELYPISTNEVYKFFSASQNAQGLLSLLHTASSLYLHNDLTLFIPLQPNSAVDRLFQRMALFLTASGEPMRLSVPTVLQPAKHGIPLAWRGFHAVLVQYAPPGRHDALLQIHTSHGVVSVAQELPSRRLSLPLTNVTVADMNAILHSLHYTAKRPDYASFDMLTIHVTFGQATAAASIFIDNSI
jgi:hypothetical protein